MKWYDIRYGITVVDDEDADKPIHYVGLEHPPTDDDWDRLKEEIETDPEFSYLDKYCWSMRHSTKEEVEFVKQTMKEQYDKHGTFPTLTFAPG
jgi:hypothetical protein